MTITYNEVFIPLASYEDKITNTYSNYVSFSNAIIYCLADCVFKTDEDALIYLLSCKEPHLSRIKRIAMSIEEYSCKKIFPVFDSQKIEVEFEKFNPNANILSFEGEILKKEPLYKIYRSYYYRISDLYQYRDVFMQKETICPFPNGFRSEVTDFASFFMYSEEFKKYDKNSQEFVKQDLIKNFAKEKKIKISDAVIEAIICILDGKLVRLGGRKKIKKKKNTTK